VQLHQLTPNAIVQLFKYFWAVISFGGTQTSNGFTKRCESDGFTKRCELHYHPKKMEIDGAVLDAQFGYLDFHTKWYKGSEAKFTVAIKNKWAAV
jgi:hypothetical protein